LEKGREGTQVNPQRQDGEMYIFSCQNGELSFEKYMEKDSMPKYILRFAILSAYSFTGFQGVCSVLVLTCMYTADNEFCRIVLKSLISRVNLNGKLMFLIDLGGQTRGRRKLFF
jgi:hypothetical protein